MSLWRRIKERLLGEAPASDHDSSRAPDASPDEDDAPEDTPDRAADRDPSRSPDDLRGSDQRERRGRSPLSGPGPAGGPAGDKDKDEVRALRRVGALDGPSVEEAIGALRRVRGTLRETEAVTAVLEAIAEHPVPDPVRVACADILATRGDEQGALRLLEATARTAPVASTAGLILAADLYAAVGQLPRALGAVERVLAREIDAPGALERHQRWRSALGAFRAPAGRLDEATMIAPAARGGPFRVLREVARGGAGTVYEAEDEILGRRIAFKVYHTQSTERGHLEREARLAAALAGPGVVRVHDVDPTEGWIALEWIPRGSIRDVLRGGDPALLVSVSRWAWPLARAITRVHAHGYVHADIKPANVLLRQLNEPVLGDFGIARPRGAPSEGGSPGYVSPERLAGRPSDTRDDIYGYGRVLEDVLVRLDALGAPADDPELAPWRALALRCMGPDEDRPEDGPALLRVLP